MATGFEINFRKGFALVGTIRVVTLTAGQQRGIQFFTGQVLPQIEGGHGIIVCIYAIDFFLAGGVTGFGEPFTLKRTGVEFGATGTAQDVAGQAAARAVEQQGRATVRTNADKSFTVSAGVTILLIITFSGWAFLVLRHLRFGGWRWRN